MSITARIIFYAIYAIYIFCLFIDWHYVINHEYFMWGVIIMIGAFIFLTCLIAAFYMAGYKIYNLSGSHVALIFGSLIFLLLAAIYYQYYMNHTLHDNVVNKINHMTYNPIIYQYGHDS